MKLGSTLNLSTIARSLTFKLPALAAIVVAGCGGGSDPSPAACQQLLPCCSTISPNDVAQLGSIEECQAVANANEATECSNTLMDLRDFNYCMGPDAGMVCVPMGNACMEDGEQMCCSDLTCDNPGSGAICRSCGGLGSDCDTSQDCCGTSVGNFCNSGGVCEEDTDDS